MIGRIITEKDDAGVKGMKVRKAGKTPMVAGEKIKAQESNRSIRNLRRRRRY
jgi:hypothetical protein